MSLQDFLKYLVSLQQDSRCISYSFFASRVIFLAQVFEGCVHSSAERASHMGGTHSGVNTRQGRLRLFTGKYTVVTIGICSFPELGVRACACARTLVCDWMEG